MMGTIISNGFILPKLVTKLMDNDTLIQIFDNGFVKYTTFSFSTGDVINETTKTYESVDDALEDVAYLLY